MECSSEFEFYNCDVPEIENDLDKNADENNASEPLLGGLLIKHEYENSPLVFLCDSLYAHTLPQCENGNARLDKEFRRLVSKQDDYTKSVLLESEFQRAQINVNTVYKPSENGFEGDEPLWGHNTSVHDRSEIQNSFQSEENSEQRTPIRLKVAIKREREDTESPGNTSLDTSKSTSRNQQTSKDYSRPHVCELCNKAFRMSSHLRDHILTHTKEKPYMCPNCNVTYRQRSHLRAHMKLKKCIKPVQCPIGLAYDEDTVRSLDRPHVCDQCSSSFKTRQGLREHKRIHTDERPYACPECGETFRQKNHVGTHLQSSRCTKNREFGVQLLELYISYGQATGEGTSVTEVDVLTREARENCLVCLLEFPSVEALIAHLKNHIKYTQSNNGLDDYAKVDPRYAAHNKDQSTNSTSSTPMKELSVSLLDISKLVGPPFECMYCSKTFRIKSHIKDHIRIHTNERPFKCTLCGNAFRQNSQLKCHVKICNGKPKKRTKGNLHTPAKAPFSPPAENINKLHETPDVRLPSFDEMVNFGVAKIEPADTSNLLVISPQDDTEGATSNNVNSDEEDNIGAEQNDLETDDDYMDTGDDNIESDEDYIPPGKSYVETKKANVVKEKKSDVTVKNAVTEKKSVVKEKNTVVAEKTTEEPEESNVETETNNEEAEQSNVETEANNVKTVENSINVETNMATTENNVPVVSSNEEPAVETVQRKIRSKSRPKARKSRPKLKPNAKRTKSRPSTKRTKSSEPSAREVRSRTRAKRKRSYEEEDSSNSSDTEIEDNADDISEPPTSPKPKPKRRPVIKHRKSTKCAVCNKVFKTPTNLKNHMMIHTGEAPYKCTFCDARFRQHNYLMRHMQILHENTSKPRASSRSHTNEASNFKMQASRFIEEVMTKHGFDPKDVPFKYSIWNADYCKLDEGKLGQTQKENIERLLGDIRQDGSNWCCLKCDFKSVKRHMVIRHIITHYEGPRKRVTYVCEYCGTSCNTRQHLNDHTRIHTGERPYKCQFCDKSYITSTAKRTHETRMHNQNPMPYQCMYCPATFRHQNFFDRHTMKHITEPKVEKIYRCDHCEKTFKHKSSFSLHTKYHMNIKPHACQVCGYKFVTKSHLRDHMVKHTDERPYSCDICHQKFKLRSSLQGHKMMHTAKGLECKVCGKRFHRETDIDYHMMKHRGDKPFDCDICGEKFIRRGDRNRHKALHSDPKRVNCPLCCKNFKSQAALDDHAWVHEDGPRFYCDQCDAVKPTKSRLDKHKYYNHRASPATKSKTFKCRFCNKIFRSGSSYKDHERKKHSEEVAAQLNAQDTSMDSTQRSMEYGGTGEASLPDLMHMQMGGGGQSSGQGQPSEQQDYNPMLQEDGGSSPGIPTGVVTDLRPDFPPPSFRIPFGSFNAAAPPLAHQGLGAGPSSHHPHAHHPHPGAMQPHTHPGPTGSSSAAMQSQSMMMNVIQSSFLEHMSQWGRNDYYG